MLSLAARFAALPAPLRGVLWMVAGTLLFALAAASVRQLSTMGFHFLQIAFFRAALGLLFLMPFLGRVGIGALKTRHGPKYLLRGAFSLMAMYGWFAGLAALPIAEATALSFTNPLFAAAGAVLLLGEPLRRDRVAALVVGFAGVLVILRPGVAAVNWGALYVIGAGVCVAVSLLIVKVVARDDRPDTIASYQLLVMLPFATLGALFVWVWPSPWEWLVALMVGGFSTTAQRCLTRAYAAADASAVMPFDFLRLPFTLAIGFVLFLELPDLWTLAGGVVIFAATLLGARGEARAARPAGAGG